MLRYEGIVPGRFCQRVNRFTAWVELAEGRTLCHVKNTGPLRRAAGGPVRRSGASTAMAPGRKTAYTLITVARDGAYFNLDSTAPMRWRPSGWPPAGRAFCQNSCSGRYPGRTPGLTWPFNERAKPCLLEVKGVTLARDGAGVFPDAPTQRGTRHVRTLLRAAQAGYGAYVLFVAAMEHVVCVPAE